MAKTKLILVILLFCALVFDAGAQKFGYSWKRIPMDGSRDHTSPTALKEQAIIDACGEKMAYLNEVIGYSPEYMPKHRPQSPLSNWFADFLIHESEKLLGERPDVSIGNMGGIRVDMPKGDVILDDLTSMFPFKNYVSLVRLSGKRLWGVLDTMVVRHKIEVLGGVKVRGEYGKGLISCEIAGAPLDPERIYTMVTNDFLLNGGDDLYLGCGVESLEVSKYLVLDFCIDYAKELKSKGLPIQASEDDRVVVLAQKPQTDKKKADKLPSGVSVPQKSAPAKGHRLTILHTNDTHSHIVPIRAGGYAGYAGIVERAAFVDSVRRADGAANVLLLDAGDYSQGSPFFTIFNGQVERDALNAMKYDASALGNHEFDNGYRHLAELLKKSRYRTVSANYTINYPELCRKVRPFAIFNRGGLKIGVIGVLCDLHSVVDHENADVLTYESPEISVNRWAEFLKTRKHCDIVIVLSHCGISGPEGNIGDVEIAERSRNVDIIIGGHTHTDLREPKYIPDADGRPVMVVTDFNWGIFVGEIHVNAEM